MAWCHQATSHYLSQCWHRSMSPYGVTRPQWVKAGCHIYVLVNYVNIGSAFRLCRAANQYGTSVFCTDFTCKIREYEFGLQNTEIELCQFCHLRYYCQNKVYLFWVANQSRFVVFCALKPSNTSLITKTFILLSCTRGSNTCSSSLPVPVVPKNPLEFPLRAYGSHQS